MEVRAVTRYTGVSAQKTRLVLNEMRGKRAEDALALLQFMPQQSARIVYKTVKSALANAVENYGYDAADMVISKIYADQAPIRRWRRFGARGRFKPWRRPSSHVTVILEERIAPAPAPKGGSKPHSAKGSGKGADKPAARPGAAPQAAAGTAAPAAALPIEETPVQETQAPETQAPVAPADMQASDVQASAAQAADLPPDTQVPPEAPAPAAPQSSDE
jgi:large subunit ribosomal protein L22